MTLLLVVAFVFALGVAGFALQNAQPITVTFLTRSWETSLVIVILGAALAGALVAMLGTSLRMIRLQLNRRQLAARVARLEEERQAAVAERDELKRRLEQVEAQARSGLGGPLPEGSDPSPQRLTPPA